MNSASEHASSGSSAHLLLLLLLLLLLKTNPSSAAAAAASAAGAAATFVIMSGAADICSLGHRADMPSRRPTPKLDSPTSQLADNDVVNSPNELDRIPHLGSD